MRHILVNSPLRNGNDVEPHALPSTPSFPPLLRRRRSSPALLHRQSTDQTVAEASIPEASSLHDHPTAEHRPRSPDLPLRRQITPRIHPQLRHLPLHPLQALPRPRFRSNRFSNVRASQLAPSDQMRRESLHRLAPELRPRGPVRILSKNLPPDP